MTKALTLPGLAALLGACTPGPAAYILECNGTQTFDWGGQSATSMTTLYYRIDEQRAAIFGQKPGGQMDNVCRSSCADMQFTPATIAWTDVSEDGEGHSTRIATRLERASGELTIRTESHQDGASGSETTLEGSGFFHCHTVPTIPQAPSTAN
ncbi:hypothetical protein MTR62_05185 [Novosphingobium sp. 1949]|uniref:Lipoprotein n=1 Tax=Novosphingobium organovorum TaxID=2930092 RepID=A0ABT0BAP1_9SPHN|nr:hypothetical protein [Novosphingobium organovorum]MCJ2182098.1 hypothetical protein [Novosphingobium organovorum]